MEKKSMETIHVQYKQARSGRLLPILVAVTSITTLTINIAIVIMIIIIIMIVLTWCADQNWPQMVFLALPSAPINSAACSNFSLASIHCTRRKNLLCLVATSCKWKLPYLKRSDMANRQMRNTDKTRSPNCTVLCHSIRIGKTNKKWMQVLGMVSNNESTAHMK